MGRKPKKKLPAKTCSVLDPRRLRSWRNNSASTSNPGRSSPKLTLSRKDSKDLRNKSENTEAKSVYELTRFERPATRLESNTRTTPGPSLHSKTKLTPGNPKNPLKKTLKSESKTDSTPSTSRLNPDQRRNQEFFIRQKRLRSEVDQDGLLERLPIMLRYPKKIETCETTVLNVDLNYENLNEGVVGQNQANYVRETISKVGSRYRYRTRQCTLHSDNSQGFLTQTQPFAIEHMNKYDNCETLKVVVSEQTNKSKSNVSQNISEAREKIKGKRKSAPTKKNLQMKTLFKELFGSESISDTSSSANESTSPKEDSRNENSIKKKIQNFENLPNKILSNIQLECRSKSNTEMTTNHDDNSDCFSSPQPKIQDCSTSSSCTSCSNDCNCKIIETSTSESESDTAIGFTSSVSLNPVISQLGADDTCEQSSVNARFSTEEETLLSSGSSAGNRIAEKQEHQGGLMKIFNPRISESRLSVGYSALSCIPGSDYSLHQSESIHIISSTTDIDITPASSVYPVNSADTTRMASLSPQKTFEGEYSIESCLPESVFSPSADDSKGGLIVANINYVNRGNRAILTSYIGGRGFGGECSTQSLIPESIYSPSNESVSSLLSSNDDKEFHNPGNTSNVCLQSISNTGTEQTTFNSIVDSKTLDGDFSSRNESNKPITKEDRVCKKDNKFVIQTVVTADGKNCALESENYNSLSELKFSDDNSTYADDNNHEHQTLIPIADGRNFHGDFSEQDCLLKSNSSPCMKTFLSSRSSVSSKDNSSVNDYPTYSSDTSQVNSFIFEITDKRCLEINKVISRLTSSSSDTSPSGQSEVNYLGKRARKELFPGKIDSLPSIEGTENDSDESNRLIIDLNEIPNNSVNKNQSFQSTGTTNRTLTDKKMLESSNLKECFEDKLLESKSFPDHQENTLVNEITIKEEMCVTSGREIVISDPNTVCPEEFSSAIKSSSCINTSFLSSIKLEQQNPGKKKELRSGSRHSRKKIFKIDISNGKRSTFSSSNESNKTNIKSNSKAKSKGTHGKALKSKLNKPDTSKSSVTNQTPKKKEQCNTKSKSKPKTPSKLTNAKTNTSSENYKNDSISPSKSPKSEQPSLDEHPAKTLTNREIRKNSSKQKTRKQTVNNPVTSDDNDMKQSLLKTSNITSPSESRRTNDRGNYTQLLSNESLEVHAKTLWCSDNRWTVCKLLGCNDSDDIEEVMNQQWEFTSPKVKLKYFSRARYALLDEDKHSMRSSRRSIEKVCTKEEDDSVVYSEALRRTAPVSAPVKNLSDMDRFIRLKPNKQRDILKRWLKFYQKMLSRKDYSNFLLDFEQALYRSRLDDLKSSPTHRLKSNDLQLNHRRILFECMKRIKPQIITNCSEKFLIRRKELDRQYSDIVLALLNNDSTNLVSGCRSNRLKDTLQDLLELEIGGHVDVRGQAVQTESYTCILNNLNINEQPFEKKQNTNILSDLPEVQNLAFYEQVLRNLAAQTELTTIIIDEVLDSDCEILFRDINVPQHGDATSNTSDPLDHSHELIENNIREIFHQEAIDAFIRSNESSTRSCCDLDSPSCIFSTWIAAEYNSLPNILASASKNDDSPQKLSKNHSNKTFCNCD